LAQALLALGLLVGISMALIGVGRPQLGGDSPPPGSVAIVGETPVSRESYETALAGLASDRREPLGQDEREHVLDRLIDEALLVDYGLELGLAARDSRTRADLSAAVIQLIVAQAEATAGEPSDSELEAFHGENSEMFRSRPQFLDGEWVRADGDSGIEAPREVVEAAWRRQLGDEALEAWLRARRAAVTVRRLEP